MLKAYSSDPSTGYSLPCLGKVEQTKAAWKDHEGCVLRLDVKDSWVNSREIILPFMWVYVSCFFCFSNLGHFSDANFIPSVLQNLS